MGLGKIWFVYEPAKIYILGRI